MVWEGISLGYRTNLHIFKRGSVTAVRYRDEVLEPTVRLYDAAVGPTFVLMDDNARPHRADIVDDYLESEGIALAETKRNHMELSRDCKGVRDHRGVAPGQEVRNDEGCVAGGIVMVELDCVFNVSPHVRDPAFQSSEHLQVKG
ncbi:transposable element Tcb1 transposase [Trichonephila clavipes]|nr:transposable element Tcb1 transposase [Trichonephila clavipes]